MDKTRISRMALELHFKDLQDDPEQENLARY
jgi:hypothetical protein